MSFREQDDLKRRLLLEDVDDWARFHITLENAKDHPARTPLEYVGGVDISFIKEDNVNACAALVVVKLSTMEARFSASPL